jgi:hypothetical protein
MDRSRGLSRRPRLFCQCTTDTMLVSRKQSMRLSSGNLCEDIKFSNIRPTKWHAPDMFPPHIGRQVACCELLLSQRAHLLRQGKTTH